MTDEAPADPKVESEPEPLNGVEAGDWVFPLRKAVIAHGDEVRELKFREPTAADIEVCGLPVAIDFYTGEQPKMTFETKSMFAMMSRLANVPPSTIKQMHAKDWGVAAVVLARRFFI
jgi:hypothetical protein